MYGVQTHLQSARRIAGRRPHGNPRGVNQIGSIGYTQPPRVGCRLQVHRRPAGRRAEPPRCGIVPAFAAAAAAAHRALDPPCPCARFRVDVISLPGLSTQSLLLPRNASLLQACASKRCRKAYLLAVNSHTQLLSVTLRWSPGREAGCLHTEHAYQPREAASNLGGRAAAAAATLPGIFRPFDRAADQTVAQQKRITSGASAERSTYQDTNRHDDVVFHAYENRRLSSLLD